MIDPLRGFHTQQIVVPPEFFSHVYRFLKILNSLSFKENRDVKLDFYIFIHKFCLARYDMMDHIVCHTQTCLVL